MSQYIFAFNVIVWIIINIFFIFFISYFYIMKLHPIIFNFNF